MDEHTWLVGLRKEISKTLRGDICSAQCLDEPLDRGRVLDEVMRTIADYASAHTLEETIN